MTEGAALDYLPISKINTVVFCPRRYFIEQLLGDTLTNYHMTEGSALHDRAKREGEGVWVWSDTLGLSGIIDQIRQEEGAWVITEFKKGYLGEHKSDQVQLCALAMCYEEAHDVALSYGYLYYHRTRRRLKIDYTPELRQRVVDAVALMRTLETQTQYPPITDNPNKCRGCSVRETCQPTLFRKRLPRWGAG